MTLNLSWVPFSAPKTYLAVSYMTQKIWNDRFTEEGLFLRTVRGGQNVNNGGLIGRIIPMANGKEVPFTFQASPWELVVSAEQGEIRMTFDRHGQMRCIGHGLDLLVSMPAGIFDEFLSYDKNRWFITSFPYGAKLLISSLSGNAEINDPGLEAVKKKKSVFFSGESWEAEWVEFSAVYQEKSRTGSYDECVRDAENAFRSYAGKAAAGCPERFADALWQAAYVNYTAQAEGDLLSGCVMLMSKNWMTSVWTWDCQFNAMAACDYDPAASWDNFASPFRRQHETGFLLDMISDHSYFESYTKPPIHGWALSYLHRSGMLDVEKKQWAYDHLLKMVNFWYSNMDWDHDGICQYNHGNDSGWDNCTYFLCGAPIEGPDLSAYLVLCWDELAALAEDLGMPEKASEHRQRGDKQLNDLIRHSWDGDHFHTYQSSTHNEMDNCDSLLPYLPVVLGNRLPKEIFDKMVHDLKEPDRFLTPYGLATEHVNDAYYISDGYWRGPVWAPAMMLIIDGLARGGEKEFAAELAERFCANCAKEGFAENFDATTGTGLRDRAYTWTSSVFMLLAKHYVKK